ncbi:MAG: nucleotidyltransferase domain-containing protein [Eubacterium sp.]|nr:nucleotidyltransferase domain-containing protein [Eubacterium sp.]MDE6154933.1 nucleotidyltransferase domain-containing protein [Eubacterium sp.]
MQNFSIDKWLSNYTDLIRKSFADRVEFIGIQGSYARGEATQSSDIDVVLLLNNFSYEDLKTYDNVISALDYREKICGFISGIDEIKNWDRADLFQFYYDTKPLYGNIDWVSSLIEKSDIIRTIHRDACNIYHMCAHNAIHEKSDDILRNILKAAVYLIREKHFYACGTYIRKAAELAELAADEDEEILCLYLENSSKLNLDTASEIIMNWSGRIIKEINL